MADPPLVQWSAHSMEAHRPPPRSRLPTGTGSPSRGTGVRPSQALNTPGRAHGCTLLPWAGLSLSLSLASTPRLKDRADRGLEDYYPEFA
eukprot:5933540-Alexandrium_andersonii.AAC.1